MGELSGLIIAARKGDSDAFEEVLRRIDADCGIALPAVFGRFCPALAGDGRPAHRHRYLRHWRWQPRGAHGGEGDQSQWKALGERSRGARTGASPFAVRAEYDWRDDEIAISLHHQLSAYHDSVEWSGAGFAGIPGRA